MKRVVSVVLAFVLVVMEMCGECMAYTVDTTGTTTINPTKSQFEKAASTVYKKNCQTINGNISAANKMNIYHYEAQYDGWYAFYTIGGTDTVGKVYEEQGLFSKSYKQIASNNDGYMRRNPKNCYMVAFLDGGEDYYVCIRGNGNTTGKYTLYIEPNADKNFYKNYGVWDQIGRPEYTCVSSCYLDRKIYLNKNQAILYYQMAKGDTTILYGNETYNLKELKSVYKSSKNTAVNICITALTTATGLVSDSVTLGITSSFVGMMIAEIYSYNESRCETVESALKNKAGVHQYFNAKTNRSLWTSKSGLCISTMLQYGYPYYFYEAYDDSAPMEGKSGYYGTWTY